MSLTNIKLKSQSERGFTIVELLIVVVVIAILAAITIVSYNGITNRANASASKSLASGVQKKAELFYAEKNIYPTQSELTSASVDTPFAVPSTTFASALPTATNGKTQVQYVTCGTPITGATIIYWGFNATDGTNGTDAGTKILTVGTVTGC